MRKAGTKALKKLKSGLQSTKSAIKRNRGKLAVAGALVAGAVTAHYAPKLKEKAIESVTNRIKPSVNKKINQHVAKIKRKSRR